MSQYRCGQGHPTPIHTQCLPTYTHTKKNIENTNFGQTDGRTDKASYRVVSPQLKREEEKEEDGEEKQR